MPHADSTRLPTSRFEMRSSDVQHRAIRSKLAGAGICVGLLIAGAGSVAAGSERDAAVTGPAAKRASLAFVQSVYRFGPGQSHLDLVVARANGRGLKPVTGESARRGVEPQYPGFLSFTRPSWAPSGRTLAFTARSGTHIVNVDGSALLRVDRSAAGPVWSPDGQTLVTTRVTFDEKREEFFSSLWAMNPDGSNRHRLIPQQKFALVDAGSFSPDGGTLAFTRREFSHADPRKADIYTVRAEGGRMRKLAERASDPSYSPDGTRIAFATERDENGNFSYGHDSYFLAHELYVMDADGRDVRRLTRTKRVNETAPAWSPDGARIAYRRGKNVYSDEENAALFAINPDGSCPRPITTARLLSRTRTRNGRRGHRVLRDYGAPAWRPGSAPGPLSC